MNKATKTIPYKALGLLCILMISIGIMNTSMAQDTSKSLIDLNNSKIVKKDCFKNLNESMCRIKKLFEELNVKFDVAPKFPSLLNCNSVLAPAGFDKPVAPVGPSGPVLPVRPTCTSIPKTLVSASCAGYLCANAKRGALDTKPSFACSTNAFTL